MSKHTPGPWTLASRKPGGPKLIVLGNEATLLAVVEDDNDARLIAAAPDLLAALKAARAALVDGPIGTGDEEIATIDAAIAKAEVAQS